MELKPTSLLGRAGPAGALALVAAALVAAAPAAAQPTTLTVRPEAPGEAYEARYSQAVLITVQLEGAEGALAGEQVVIEVQAEGGDAPVTLLPSPTDGQGRAIARLTLVNGRHGGASFPAAEEGLPYSIRASYAGTADDDDPACLPDAGVPDPDAGPTGTCASEGEGELLVTLENVVLQLEPGNVAALNEEMTLIATLVDANGDAEVGGTAIDNDEEKPIADVSVAFFFDLDGNERPSADERIGASNTDSNGIAVLTFLVDPAVFPAGEAEEGLHVQYGGDDRYAIAGASGRVNIEAGGPDPDRCVIEIDPPEAELIGDGTSTLTLVGTLVDEGNNILGVDALDHEVSFTAALGTVLLEGAERDALTGTYHQAYRVPEVAGAGNSETETITIVVDGVAGNTRDFTFEGTGCTCVQAAPGTPAALALVGLLALTFRRRRRPFSAGSAT